MVCAELVRRGKEKEREFDSNGPERATTFGHVG